MPRGQAALMRLDLECPQRVVEFIATTHGESLLPVAGVWIQGITELVMAAVGFGIGPSRRPEERESKYIVLGVVSILRFVDQAETAITVAEVGPAECGDLEFRRVPTLVARGGTLD